jgi:peptidoglycan L-alanyl-D-glutamate endopeptidase CwlK
MPKFSKTSLDRLDTCHPKLKGILNKAIAFIDFTIVCGHRNELDQNQAFAENKSDLKYPDSKHNKMPSEAVDVAFWDGKGLVWDIRQAAFLAGYIKATADGMGIKIRLGGDWDRDYNITDEKFIDMPHIELDE